MRRFLFASFCLGGLWSPSFAGECTMAIAARLPWQMQGGSLLVDAALNGKPAHFIFDTGAETSVVSLEAARRLDLRLMKGEEFDALHLRVSGVGGNRSAIGVTARSVELGGLRARHYNFIAADVVRPPADGLLSADLISQFDIDLDYPEQQAVLYYPTGDCSAPAAFLAGPLSMVPLLPIGEDRRPRVRVQVGEHEVVAAVDTGATHSAIFAAAAATLGVRPDETAKDTFQAHGIGPQPVSASREVFEAVSVGDLTISNMPLDVLRARAGADGVEMLLGTDFQRRVHLWISYSSHSLIMQYPPQPSKRRE